MKRLTEVIKRRIFELLACYHSHAEVTDLIHQEFDVSLTSRHVRSYDPMCFQFAGGVKWRDYHAGARKRFLEDVAAIPIANRAFRLRRLGQMHEKAFVRGNYALAADMLERAAKEMGNAYVNVARAQGVVLPGQIAATVRTPAENRNMLSDRLKDAISRLPKAKKQLTEH